MGELAKIASFGEVFSKKEIESPEYLSSIRKIEKMIKNSDNIVVLPHAHADGDAWGTALGLASAIKGIGKKVIVYAEESMPETFNHLPNKDLITTALYPEQNNIGLIICVDTATRELLGYRQSMLDIGIPTINIDHHGSNEKYAQHNLIVSSASAAAEVIYDAAKSLNKEAKLDYDTATSLYTGIVSDSQGFKTSQVTPRTFEVAGELLKSGVQGGEIIKNLFNIESIERKRLKASVIMKMELYDKNRIAYACITDKMMDDSGVKRGEGGGMVEVGTEVKGVQASFTLSPRTGGLVICSMRSNTDDINVSKIAKEFGGGGHLRAAAFRLRGNVNEIKGQVLEEISKQLKEAEKRQEMNKEMSMESAPLKLVSKDTANANIKSFTQDMKIAL